MKKYLKTIQDTLEPFGFSLVNIGEHESDNKYWFVSSALSKKGTDYCLQFEFKKTINVIELRHGWNNQVSRTFFLDALEKYWPKNGYDWFNKSGLLNHPSVLMHNLSYHLGYMRGGLSARNSKMDSEQLNSLKVYLSNVERWQNLDCNNLLDLYLADNKPVTWASCISTIRIALIAALIIETNRSLKVFDHCVSKYSDYFQPDMLNAGNYYDWVRSLRNEIVINKTNGKNQ